jgi:hypothetical protein
MINQTQVGNIVNHTNHRHKHTKSTLESEHLNGGKMNLTRFYTHLLNLQELLNGSVYCHISRWFILLSSSERNKESSEKIISVCIGRSEATV